jgi:hypothetical protein
MQAPDVAVCVSAQPRHVRLRQEAQREASERLGPERSERRAHAADAPVTRQITTR